MNFPFFERSFFGHFIGNGELIVTLDVKLNENVFETLQKMEEGTIDFSTLGSSGLTSTFRNIRNPLEQSRTAFSLFLSMILQGDISNPQIAEYFEEARKKIGTNFIKVNPRTLAAAYALVHSNTTPSQKNFVELLDKFSKNLKESQVQATQTNENLDDYKADIFRYYRLVTK